MDVAGFPDRIFYCIRPYVGVALKQLAISAALRYLVSM